MSALSNDILESPVDWTFKKHEVATALVRRVANVDATVENDIIVIRSNGRPMVTVEAVSPNSYITKTNANGDPRNIIGGGKIVPASSLVAQIQQDLVLLAR